MIEPIKVAMISQGYFPVVGGAERQLASLAPLLLSKGIDVTIYTKRTQNLPSFEYIEGVPVNRLTIMGSRAARSFSFTAGTLMRLKRSPPDLIHAHDFLSPSTTALLAKKLFRIPVLVKVVRGGDLGDVQWLLRRAFGRRRLKFLCDNVDKFICISREIDAELAQIGVAATRRAQIPNGVDCQRFQPASAEGRKNIRAENGLPDGPIVVYAGRLAVEKRVASLVKIWPSVRATVPEAILAVVGTGEEERSLRKLAGDGVLFIGAVDDVSPYLRAADIFVLPSVAEGLSNALLEAMATGLACVATDVGGASDLISNQVSGVLIPPDDTKALFDQLVGLLVDPVTRTPLGRRAREFVKHNFALDHVADKLVALYHETVSRRNR